MTTTLSSARIEVEVDATKLRAGISDAKRQIASLGAVSSDVTQRQSASIDRYVRQLAIQASTIGKSTTEAKLLELGLRGASDAQLAAAAASLKMVDAHEKAAAAMATLKTGFITFGALAAGGIVAAAAGFDHFVKSAADFQHLAEKIGDSATNVASLAVAAKVGGIAMDSVAAASAKLTKNLTGVDDDSKNAGAAIQALGLNLKDFKQLAAGDQFETIAKALEGFADGTGKTAVAMALFGKSGSDVLPFLKELSGEIGRQKILTSEQIELAKKYADRQAALKEQISLHASAIVTQMLPAYADFTGALLDTIKGIAGVDSGVKGLTNSNDDIKAFAEDGARSLAFLADSAQGVARTFGVAGRSIAGAAALTALTVKGEFREALTVGETMAEDINRILNQPLFSKALDDRIAARKLAEAQTTTKPNRPRLNFEGATTKAGLDTAAQEAKAQLAFDLDQIKKASDATIATFANSEKIMQAMRAAGLVEDRTYYAAKLGFITANSATQEAELQKEIARLQQETFVGKTAAKDRIDNARKIADAEFKIARIREDAAANVQVNSIQEDAAIRAVIQGMKDRENAAIDYLTILRETNSVSLASMNLGDVEASRLAARLQIEKKYTEDIKNLNRTRATAEFAGTFGPEAQKKYDDELDRIRRFQATALSEYDVYFSERLRKESDWTVGASKALANISDESRNTAKLTENVFTNSFKSIEDALVSLSTTGKVNFKSLFDSINAEITRMSIKQAITGPLAEFLKGGTSSGGIREFLGKIVGASGLGGTQSAAPVEARSIADAISGTTKTASDAASGAAFAGAVTGAGAGFGGTVATAATTFAGIIAESAGTFASIVTGSGAAPGGVPELLNSFGGPEVLGSFASGVAWVPQTGPYILHQGERVVKASENKMGGGRSFVQNITVNVLPGATRQSADQAAAAMYAAGRRAYERIK